MGETLIQVGFIFIIVPLLIGIVMGIAIPGLWVLGRIVEGVGIAVLIVLLIVTAPIRWVHKQF